MVQDFLLQNAPQGTDSTKDSVPCPEHHFQDLADWYGELSYTWLRLCHYTSEKDAAKSYMWGIYLQSELNQVCGDFGLRKMDLMSAFDAENLQALAERAVWNRKCAGLSPRAAAVYTNMQKQRIF